MAFVLDVDMAEVHRHAYGTRTFDAPAAPIPVQLSYYTRFVDASGQIVTYADIYNLGAQSGQPVGAVDGRDLACVLSPAQLCFDPQDPETVVQTKRRETLQVHGRNLPVLAKFTIDLTFINSWSAIAARLRAE